MQANPLSRSTQTLENDADAADSDSLFGSPPSSPRGRGRDRTVNALQHPRARTMSAALPASSARLTPVAQRPRAPSAPTQRKSRKGKGKASSCSATPRPTPPPIELPPPDQPPPPNFLRNQQALLGLAGLVGRVNPAQLSKQRGSTPQNPIVLEDDDAGTGPLTSQPSISRNPPVTPVGRHPLPAPPGEEVIASLIREKNILPVVESLLRLLSGPAATAPRPPNVHARTGWERQDPNAAPPLKRRKLNRVPAGATDWDVPYPFQEGQGPEGYQATWAKERAQALIADLVGLLRKAAQKAAAKEYYQRRWAEKNGGMPSGHYRPATAFYGSQLGREAWQREGQAQAEKTTAAPPATGSKESSQPSSSQAQPNQLEESAQIQEILSILLAASNAQRSQPHSQQSTQIPSQAAPPPPLQNASQPLPQVEPRPTSQAEPQPPLQAGPQPPLQAELQAAPHIEPQSSLYTEPQPSSRAEPQTSIQTVQSNQPPQSLPGADGRDDPFDAFLKLGGTSGSEHSLQDDWLSLLNEFPPADANNPDLARNFDDALNALTSSSLFTDLEASGAINFDFSFPEFTADTTGASTPLSTAHTTDAPPALVTPPTVTQEGTQNEAQGSHIDSAFTSFESVLASEPGATFPDFLVDPALFDALPSTTPVDAETQLLSQPANATPTDACNRVSEASSAHDVAGSNSASTAAPLTPTLTSVESGSPPPSTADQDHGPQTPNWSWSDSLFDETIIGIDQGVSFDASAPDIMVTAQDIEALGKELGGICGTANANGKEGPDSIGTSVSPAMTSPISTPAERIQGGQQVVGEQTPVQDTTFAPDWVARLAESLESYATPAQDMPVPTLRGRLNAPTRTASSTSIATSAGAQTLSRTSSAATISLASLPPLSRTSTLTSLPATSITSQTTLNSLIVAAQQQQANLSKALRPAPQAIAQGTHIRNLSQAQPAKPATQADKKNAVLARARSLKDALEQARERAKIELWELALEQGCLSIAITT
ncbi:hypothetical protein WOLCODRAFT_144047 [Wolfiporia cocos MD-104 SS10]|uniref:Uncharacterized protein n=1 Tax=Wolfiporia cocos (strain MD-104) TaxID=742152 RepID=A0A2H3JJP9_WOLCO|nr:hypothetical protein WOLCODRAFT_144047 [Wolfiporia cocos MD-104 SS10]